MDFSATLLLVLAFAAANLPFLIERVFLVIPPRAGHKRFAWRLLEFVALFFIVGGIARLLESRLGPPHSQGWEFYAVNAALFIVFAFPGFVWRFLWRHRGA